MKIFFFFIIIILSNCSNPKTVLICGDHICVNKAEAEQYFEDNLSLEVQIINNKNDKEQLDLVELNLKSKSEESRKISIIKKKSTKKKIKKLSKNQIIKKKKDINKRIKNKKINIAKTRQASINETKNQDNIKKQNLNKKKKMKLSEKNIPKSQQKTNKKSKQIVDICTILDKCTINEISDYLIKQGEKKNFPDITIKE